VFVLVRAGRTTQKYEQNVEIVSDIVSFLFFMGMIYFNIYVLVPRLLFRNRLALYIIAVLLAIMVFLGLSIFWEKICFEYFHITPQEPDMNWLTRLLALVIIFAIFLMPITAAKLFQRWVRDSSRLHELEKNTIKTELDQLKNQINPHFLFNMLNNASVLTHKDADKASLVLTRLSDLLRYQLYDSAREKVLLSADIQFLTDFLNLEKVRRDCFEFSVDTEGEIGFMRVPPLLFIPFVENAVKHNLDAEKHSYVKLHFKVTGSRLHFTCINSKPEKQTTKAAGGLGLANVRRRLELLYPESHNLTINDEPGMFRVELEIINKNDK
jgi:LytS/YehU family sensor histidine kinase